MEHEDVKEPDLEELKELTPQSEGLEAYYDACVTVLRSTFLRVSETAKDIQLPTIPAESTEANKQESGSATPGTVPEGVWYPISGRPLPPGVTSPPRPPMLGTGFHLIEVTRVGPFALIAFQWHETGEEIYVHTADLRTFVADRYAVGMVDTIVVINLLERLGLRWYQHAKLRHIQGLTFME